MKLFNYHTQKRKFRTSAKTEWKIGVEIEKVDNSIKNSELDAKAFYTKTKWILERDGSLRGFNYNSGEDDFGFELVSPVYALYTNTLKKTIKKNKTLQNLISADYNGKCGGHIHLSHIHKQPIEIFRDHFISLLGFFNALYPTRSNSYYCLLFKLKENIKNVFDANRPAFAISKENITLEIRIFPAVKHEKNLFWRVKLLQILVAEKNTVDNFIQKLCNKKSPISKHLAKSLPRQRVHEIATKMVKFSFEKKKAKETTLSNYIKEYFQF